MSGWPAAAPATDSNTAQPSGHIWQRGFARTQKPNRDFRWKRKPRSNNAPSTRFFSEWKWKSLAALQLAPRTFINLRNRLAPRLFLIQILVRLAQQFLHAFAF